ncbi:hypothetical protein X975_01300, partial [Stegodyphus mimosarum]
MGKNTATPPLILCSCLRFNTGIFCISNSSFTSSVVMSIVKPFLVHSVLFYQSSVEMYEAAFFQLPIEPVPFYSHLY